MAMSMFWWGVLGGIMAETFKWYQLYRDSPNLPAYVTSPFYWGVTIIMILIGGGLAFAYDLDPPNPLLAINIGASAPLIVKALAAAAPQAPNGRGGGVLAPAQPSLREFLAGY